jgi:hypothetical protein
MRFAFLCTAIAVLCLISGCARVATTTAIHADGSFTRKVVYTVSKMTGMGGPSAGDAKDKPEDYFKLPVAGPGVKVVRTDGTNGPEVTVTREVAADSQGLQDITLWSEKGKPMATSTVTVRKLSNGQIEYVELLHALTPNPKAQDYAIAELRARIKKSLPAEYQKTEIIDQLTKGVTANLLHALFGPPESNLAGLLANPDVTLRRVNATAFASNKLTFKEAIPALTEEQAAEMSRSLNNILNQDTLNASSAADQASKPKENSSGNEMNPLFFVVSFPGKIVSTNGIIDPVTGEVYWSLLAAALDLGDVQLRVLVQP